MTNWDPAPAKKEPPPKTLCVICEQPEHGYRACLSHVMVARIEKLKKEVASLVFFAKNVREWRAYWNENNKQSSHDDKIWTAADDIIRKLERERENP